MTDVTIVCIGDAGEAIALRSLLESMSHEVRLIRVGTPADVAPALIRASEHDVVILSAHAGRKGLYMGAFGAGVDVSMMDGDWLPMAAVFKGVQFREDAVLISTGGAARESGLVQAMFQAGGHLIAPNGDPDGRVIVPWIGACLLQTEAGLAEAVTRANALVAPENRFSYG